MARGRTHRADGRSRAAAGRGRGGVRDPGRATTRPRRGAPRERAARQGNRRRAQAQSSCRSRAQASGHAARCPGPHPPAGLAQAAPATDVATKHALRPPCELPVGVTLAALPQVPFGGDPRHVRRDGPSHPLRIPFGWLMKAMASGTGPSYRSPHAKTPIPTRGIMLSGHGVLRQTPKPLPKFTDRLLLPCSELPVKSRRTAFAVQLVPTSMG